MRAGAVRELAVLVAEDDGGAQVGRDGAGGAADVQRLAEAVKRSAEQGAAQVGGDPAGAGNHVDAGLQEGGLPPGPGFGWQRAPWGGLAVAAT